MAGESGAPRGKLRHSEKLTVLRALVALLIWFHIQEVGEVAAGINYELVNSPLNEASIDQSAQTLGSQCMQVSPGLKGEIFELLKVKLRQKPARHHPDSLSWLKASFPKSKPSFHWPGLSEIARIRTFIKCTGLPPDAEFIVILESAKQDKLAGKKRNWFKTHEVDPLFKKFDTGKHKTHLVFVERKERYYDLLVIVCPPCVQGVALTCADKEWHSMFADMVERSFGSKSHREVDKGFRVNKIFMSGFRWTRNFDYCYCDICAGPLTPSPSAAADVYVHASFEESMEKFANRMVLLLEAISPDFAAAHRQHIGEYT
jgi:hypothetical protein